MGVILELP